MIELRWKLDEKEGFKHDLFTTWKGERWKLQYRYFVSIANIATSQWSEWIDVRIANIATSQWSEWIDVPYVSEE